MTWKSLSGIILTAFYAFTMRVLAEMNVFDVNSYSFLFIVPCIMSFIPFFMGDQAFLKSRWRTIFFPLLSAVLFLVIAVVSSFEDLVCFLIIGIPYIVFSIIMSLVLRSFLLKTDDEISKKAYSVLLLPVVLGMIEKEISKQSSEVTISNSVVIEKSAEEIFPNLLSVPDLRGNYSTSVLNDLGVPHPIKSEYDSVNNVRLGYFSDGFLLHETVSERIENEKLSFDLKIEQSNLGENITLRHILKENVIVFDDISYELASIDSNKTNLTLSCSIQLNSNMAWYGKIWGKWIIDDFEKQLLQSLKYKLEISSSAS